MTTRYSLNELRNKHLVFFKKPSNIQSLSYYDFTTKTWRLCEIIEQLPYGLFVYKFLDEYGTKNGKDGENNAEENNDELNMKNKIITCNDSYRIMNTNELSEYDLAILDDYMEKEKNWRDLLVKGSELDLYFEKSNIWIKAHIKYDTFDIISSVFNIMPRKNNFVSLGFYYKDSNKLAESCTYTDEISEEELQKELEKERLFDEDSKRNDEKLNNIKKQLKKIIIPPVAFYDYIPYYLSLNIVDYISYDKLILLNDDFKNVMTLETWDKEKNVRKAYYYMLYDSNIDGVIYPASNKCAYDKYTNNAYFKLIGNGDAIYNIKIHGIMKNDIINARLEYADCYDFNNSEQNFDNIAQEISNVSRAEISTSIEAIWNNDIQCYTFPDFSKSNPLLQPRDDLAIYVILAGSKIIESENIKISYDAIILKSFCANIISFGLDTYTKAIYVPSKKSYIILYTHLCFMIKE